MIEPFEQIFKTFGFFGLFISMLIVVIVTLYKRDEKNRETSEKQHLENMERIKALEMQRDTTMHEEKELLLKVIQENTLAMKRISFYIKKLKNENTKE